MLTPADLARLQQLHAQAIKTPWVATEEEVGMEPMIYIGPAGDRDKEFVSIGDFTALGLGRCVLGSKDQTYAGYLMDKAHAALIVETRNALPNLLALAALGLRVQEMRERIAHMKHFMGEDGCGCEQCLTVRDLLAALARLDTGQER